MRRNRNRVKSAEKIIIFDIVLFVLIITMFLLVKCRKHDLFSYKEDYKSISLEGKWYMVENSDVHIVKMDDENYVVKDVNNNIIKKGTYEIGNHAIKLDEKIYSMEYTDEFIEAEYLADTSNLKNYDLARYFVIKKPQSDVYYYSSKEAAEDKVNDDYYTNDYFEKSGILDNYGFAIDGDDCLVAYVGEDESIKLEGEITSVGENAFATDYDRAKNLKKVYCSSTIEKIDPYAFAFSNVEEVYVNSNIKVIKNDAFSDSSLKHIYLPEDTTGWEGNIFGNLTDVTIHVKAGSAAENYVKTHMKSGTYQLSE